MGKAPRGVIRVIGFATTLTSICVVFGHPVEAATKIIHESAVLTAMDGQAGDGFGAALALNVNTLVVGAPYSNALGAAYVFAGSGTTWTQVAKLTPSDGSTGGQFGFSVTLSGNTVAVGAPFDQAVYVFVKPAEGWRDMTETAKITYRGGNLGYSVAFAGGDKFLVTGAFFLNAVYSFEKAAGGWANMTAPSATLVTPPDATAFGNTLVTSGATAIVGAYGTNNEAGAAYVFQLQTGVSNIAALIPSDGGGLLGEALAIDGRTVVAGAQGRNNGAGASYVFVEPARGWSDATQTAELGSGTKQQTAFGAAVAIHAGTIFVGLPSARLGTVEAFIKPASGWANSTNPNFALRPSVSSNYFGEVLAVNSTVLTAGDISTNQFRGAVYLFQSPR